MNNAEYRRSGVLGWGRIAGWGAIVVLILLPAVAMHFTDAVRWTAADFAFATVMLGGVGLAFEMALRANGSRAYRGGAAVALGAALVLLWVNAAVGIVGDEGNRINLWFDLVPLLALFGALGARFRPHGMAVAMLATAAAQVAVGAIVQLNGHFVWVLTLIWAGAWLSAAALFRKASGGQGQSSAT